MVHWSLVYLIYGTLTQIHPNLCTSFFCHFWRMNASIPIHFHCMKESSMTILPSISVSVLQRKVKARVYLIFHVPLLLSAQAFQSILLWLWARKDVIGMCTLSSGLSFKPSCHSRTQKLFCMRTVCDKKCGTQTAKVYFGPRSYRFITTWG